VIARDLREYGELRADVRLFLVGSGHVVESVDELIEKRDRYDLPLFYRTASCGDSQARFHGPPATAIGAGCRRLDP
jgi:hypothetical protein